jgi:hypothetical protein
MYRRNTMSLKHIQNFSLKSYDFLVRTVPIILGESDNRFLYNRVISKNYYNLGPTTFEGYMSCGASCYLLHHYLKKQGVETRIMKKKIGYGDYLQDHCYLLYNDSLIIDPTWRQFFTDYVATNNNYSKILFNNYPFIFIGDIDSLYRTYNRLNTVHFSTYDIKLEVEICDFWENAADISKVLDCTKVLEDRDYAKNKGKLFIKLHDYVSINNL